MNTSNLRFSYHGYLYILVDHCVSKHVNVHGNCLQAVL